MSISFIKWAERSEVLTIINSSFYRDSARKILNTIDESPVPVDWASIDEDELIKIIARALVDIDRETGLIRSAFYKRSDDSKEIRHD